MPYCGRTFVHGMSRLSFALAHRGSDLEKYTKALRSAGAWRVLLRKQLAVGWLLVPLLGLVFGCAEKSDETQSEAESVPALNPSGDEDGDGHTNGAEVEMGSDPLDASDVPYAGGWKKAPCSADLDITGDGVGQTPGDFALVDQYGEDWYLHDFCDSTVMLEFSGFT